jgi:ABC-type microcin C transport system permease subunit YejB
LAEQASSELIAHSSTTMSHKALVGVTTFARQNKLSAFFGVIGMVLFYGFIFVFVNLLVDISYGWVDPRIRYE